MAEEFTPRKDADLGDSLWILMNSALAGRYVAASLHNRGVTEELKRSSASVPAYLARQ